MTESSTTTTDFDDEYATAEQALSVLEERVLDGDTAVTVEEIDSARKRLDFLGLRRKGAERAETKRAQAERQAQVDAVLAEAREFADAKLLDLQKKYESASDALTALAAALREREEARTDLGRRARPFRDDPAVADTLKSIPVFKFDTYLDFAVAEAKGADRATPVVFPGHSVEADRAGAIHNGMRMFHELHTPARRKKIAEQAAARRPEAQA